MLYFHNTPCLLFHGLLIINILIINFLLLSTLWSNFTGWRLLRESPIRSLFWRTSVNMVWRQRACVTMNYVDQQLDDDYVLPHQRLWTFDEPGCPVFLSATLDRAFPVAAARPWNSLPSHVTAASPSQSSHVVLNQNLFSLSYPAFWLFSHFYSARAVTHHFGHLILLHLTFKCDLT